MKRCLAALVALVVTLSALAQLTIIPGGGASTQGRVGVRLINGVPGGGAGGLPTPLLRWNLDDGSGTAIVAANGPAGTTDASWVTGKSGSGFALDFNGTDDNASSNASVTYGAVGVITVAGWVWLDDTTNLQILFESSAVGTNPGTFVIYVNTSKINVGVSDSGGLTRIESVATPATGAWFHLAAVLDNTSAAGNLKIFINAEEQATTVEATRSGSASTFTDQTLYVGARDNSSLFFNGRIDDLRIYNRELTALEIAFAMDLPSSVTAASASYADVFAAYVGCAPNGTVTIPAGSATWASAINNSRGISFDGAGSGRIIARSQTSNIIGTGAKTFTTQAGLSITPGQTLRVVRLIQSTNFMEGTVTSYSGTTLVINITSVGGSGTHDMWWIATQSLTILTHGSGVGGDLFTLTESPAVNIRIRGIRFLGGDVGSNHIQILYNAVGKPVWLDQCWFSPRGNSWAIRSKTTRGLISNCSADDDFAINSLIQIETASTTSWATASTMGAADTDGRSNFYIEDSYIVGFLTASDFSDNSRAVVRHCVSDHNAWGTHGTDTGSYGNRHCEFYDNTFVFYGRSDGLTVALPDWFYLRGGTGVITDNVIPLLVSNDYGTKATLVAAVQNLRRNGGPHACWGAGIPGIQYPSPHQVGWGHNGSSDIVEPFYSWDNTGGAQEHVWFFSPNEFSPNECGVDADSVVDYIQENRDYFIGVVKPGYTKYTYPHPLRP